MSQVIFCEILGHAHVQLFHRIAPQIVELVVEGAYVGGALVRGHGIELGDVESQPNNHNQDKGRRAYPDYRRRR
ncbi:MAG TPA: hypothetical protein VNY05_30150 [Candidatus Acidoferrales bacterium]|nr:hypothetical protein [Candidatus Acidoferrales bacterium]